MLSQIKEWKLYDNLENQSELSWEGKRAVYKSNNRRRFKAINKILYNGRKI